MSPAAPPKPLAVSWVVVDRATWAVLFLAVSVAFTTALRSQFTLPKLFWLQALAPVLLVVWVVRARRGEVLALPRLVLLAAAALVTWWGVTTLTAAHPMTALQGMHGRWNGLATQATMVLLFLLAASSITSRHELEVRLKILIATLFPIAAWTLGQYFGFDPIEWPNPRPASTIGHPVPLAALLAMALLPAIGFAMTARGALQKTTWRVTVAVLAFAIVATLSRGPWVATAAAVGVLVLLAWRHGARTVSRRALTAAAATVIVAAFVFPQTTQRLLFTTRVNSLFTLAADPSFMNRFVFFEAASGMVRDSPLVGVGLEGYGLLYPRYRPVEGERTVLDELPSKVHNGYLQAAVTTGIPGLVLYLLLLGVVLVPLWIAAWRRADDGEGRAHAWPWLAAGIFSGLLSYCIQDVSGWHEVSLSLVFWTLLGFGAAAPLVAPAATSARLWTMPARHAAVATVGVLAVAAAIAGGAFGTLRMLVADYRLAVLQQLDVMRDWTAAQSHIAAVQRFAPANPYYDDAVAVQLMRRVAAARDADAYRAGVELLERSRRNFPFDSYVLVHRIDLDTAAIRSGLMAEASPEARAALDELVRVDPNNSTVYECAARLAMAERRWPDAEQAIDRAIALRPRVAGYRLTRGDIARAQGDLAGQIAAYRAAFAELGPLDAGWRSAGHKLAVTLIEGGQYAEALEIANAMLEQGPDAITLTLAGAANLGLGARPAAVQAFQRALELDSSNVSARRGLEEAARTAAPVPR